MNEDKKLKAVLQLAAILGVLGWSLILIGAYLLGGFAAWCLMMGVFFTMIAERGGRSAKASIEAKAFINSALGTRKRAS